jgi:hypothetical protein
MQNDPENSLELVLDQSDQNDKVMSCLKSVNELMEHPVGQEEIK